jgi:hypothetical protein
MVHSAPSGKVNATAPKTQHTLTEKTQHTNMQRQGFNEEERQS